MLCSAFAGTDEFLSIVPRDDGAIVLLITLCGLQKFEGGTQIERAPDEQPNEGDERLKDPDDDEDMPDGEPNAVGEWSYEINEGESDCGEKEKTLNTKSYPEGETIFSREFRAGSQRG